MLFRSFRLDSGGWSFGEVDEYVERCDGEVAIFLLRRRPYGLTPGYRTGMVGVGSCLSLFRGLFAPSRMAVCTWRLQDLYYNIQDDTISVVKTTMSESSSSTRGEEEVT